MRKYIFLLILLSSCKLKQLDLNKPWIIVSKKHDSWNYDDDQHCIFKYTDGRVIKSFPDSCHVYNIGDTLKK